MPAAPGPSGVTLTASVTVAKSVSPYTRQRQGYIHPGACWIAKISLPVMTRAQAEPWLAFLISLWGMSGSFLLQAPLVTGPLGTAGGSPVVNGSNQPVNTPQSLSIRGLTGILQPGDYFQIGNRLYKNLTQKGTGTVTLDIFPTLRDNPADGTALVLANPAGLFELDDNDVQFDVDSAGNYRVQFGAYESI